MAREGTRVFARNRTDSEKGTVRGSPCRKKEVKGTWWGRNVSQERDSLSNYLKDVARRRKGKIQRFSRPRPIGEKEWRLLKGLICGD